MDLPFLLTKYDYIIGTKIPTTADNSSNSKADIKKSNDKYTFYDIFVFKKTQMGYISLSDFNFREMQNKIVCKQFPSDSEYLLAFWGGHGTNRYLISDTNLAELQLLAYVSPNSHLCEQCKCHLDAETSNDIIAYICAKRIIGRTNCKVQSLDEEGMTFAFKKRLIAKGKCLYPTMLIKEFVWG